MIVDNLEIRDVENDQLILVCETSMYRYKQFIVPLKVLFIKLEIYL